MVLWLSMVLFYTVLLDTANLAYHALHTATPNPGDVSASHTLCPTGSEETCEPSPWWWGSPQNVARLMWVAPLLAQPLVIAVLLVCVKLCGRQRESVQREGGREADTTG